MLEPRPDDVVLGGGNEGGGPSPDAAVLGGKDGLMVHILRVSRLDAEYEFLVIQKLVASEMWLELTYQDGLLEAWKNHFRALVNKKWEERVKAGDAKLQYGLKQLDSKLLAWKGSMNS